MNTHKLPMKYQRQRSRPFSAQTKRKLAVAAYERQKEPAKITLPPAPWETDDAQTTLER